MDNRMGQTPNQRNHSEELLNLSTAAIAGQLDAESLTRLEIILDSSDEACEEWLKLMQFHADLSTITAASFAEKRSIASLSIYDLSFQEQLVRPEPIAESLRAVVAPSIEEKGSFFSSSLLSPGLMALAASLLFVSFVFLWSKSQEDRVVQVNLNGHPFSEQPMNAIESVQATMGDLIRIIRPPRKVANLVEVTDAEWGLGDSIEVGQFFSEGEVLQLNSGTAQISMMSGADIVLQAPCTIILVNDRLVRLEKGKLTAQVAEWAHGFVVETQGLRVTDLGTRFAVSAESPDTAEAHVLEGSILVEPALLQEDRNAKLLLVSGEAIRVGKHNARIDRVDAERKRFVDGFDEFHPYRPISLFNTGRGFEIGSEDPHWKMTAGGEAWGPWPRPAIVNKSHLRYSDNAPERSQWISIPRGTKDGIAPKELKNMTFTFETSFDLSGFDPETITITAQVLADNGVQAVRLNGEPVSMMPWTDDGNYFKFNKFRQIKIHDGFVPGENRIEFDVINLPLPRRKKGLANPMALRVEWQAFGIPVIEL